MSERLQKVETVFNEVRGDIEALKVQFGAVVDKVIQKSGTVIAEYGSLIELVDDLVEIADNKTNTGLADAFDGPAARALARLIIKDSAEKKFQEARAAILAEINKVQ